MTPRRAEVPFRAERAYACPECGTWMQVQHNPSYGSGLAVHPYVTVCGKCGWANFVETVPAAVPAPPARRRGLLAWLTRRRVRR